MEILDKHTVVKPYQTLNKEEAEIEYTTTRLATAAGEATQLAQNFQNKIKIPGFRKGKIPRPVLERRFGKEAMYGQHIHNKWLEYIATNQILVTSNASVENIQVRLDGSISFEAISLIPTLLQDLTLEKEYEVNTFDDITKKVGETLQGIREKHSKRIEIKDKPAIWSNIVNFSYDGKFTDEENLNPMLSATDLTITIGTKSVVVPELEEALVDMSINDSKKLTCNLPENLAELLPKNPQAAALAGKEVEFDITLHEIFTIEKPEDDKMVTLHTEEILKPLMAKKEPTKEDALQIEALQKINNITDLYNHIATETYEYLQQNKENYISAITHKLIETHKAQLEASVSVAMLDIRIKHFLDKYQEQLAGSPKEEKEKIINDASTRITNGIFEDIILYSLMPLYTAEIVPTDLEIKGRQEAIFQMVKQKKANIEETNYWANYQYIQEVKLKETLSQLIVLKFDIDSQEYLDLLSSISTPTKASLEEIIEESRAKELEA